jgi:hypothetical protein
VHDYRWPRALDQTEYGFPVANINVMMLVSGNAQSQSLQRPGSITLRPEEHGALVVVDTQYRVPSLVKMQAHLGSN